MCHCGISAAAKQSGGSVGWGHAVWRRTEGQASQDESAAAAGMLGGRGTAERDSWRGSCLFIEFESSVEPVHAHSPIRRAPNPAGRTPRLRLHSLFRTRVYCALK